MPMFENLTDRLQGIFDRLGAKGHLTEEDVDEALKQVRLALLEADVNFKVVREFIAKVRERAIGPCAGRAGGYATPRSIDSRTRSAVRATPSFALI